MVIMMKIHPIFPLKEVSEPKTVEFVLVFVLLILFPVCQVLLLPH